MELYSWLKKEGKTRRWLAAELGVTAGFVTNAFKRKERYGTPLPYTWIPTILRITKGEVSVRDEWPEKHGKKKKDGTSHHRKEEVGLYQRSAIASLAKKKVGVRSVTRVSEGNRTKVGYKNLAEKVDGA